jgi:hypothetical protein
MTTSRICKSCGSQFDAEAWQKLCWCCWRRESDREAADAVYHRGYSDGYDLGYGRGYRDGHKRGYGCGREDSGPATRPVLADDLIAGAIRLCHPDRHPAERFVEANAITARLLALRAAEQSAQAAEGRTR